MNKWFMSLLRKTSVWKAFEAELESAAKAAYSDGSDDGYKTGYKDGVTDGRHQRLTVEDCLIPANQEIIQRIVGKAVQETRVSEAAIVHNLYTEQLNRQSRMIEAQTSAIEEQAELSGFLHNTAFWHAKKRQLGLTELSAIKCAIRLFEWSADRLKAMEDKNDLR